jgi:hypothetical protein
MIGECLAITNFEIKKDYIWKKKAITRKNSKKVSMLLHKYDIANVVKIIEVGKYK